MLVDLTTKGLEHIREMFQGAVLVVVSCITPAVLGYCLLERLPERTWHAAGIGSSGRGRNSSGVRCTIEPFSRISIGGVEQGKIWIDRSTEAQLTIGSAVCR